MLNSFILLPGDPFSIKTKIEDTKGQSKTANRTTAKRRKTKEQAMIYITQKTKDKIR